MSLSDDLQPSPDRPITTLGARAWRLADTVSAPAHWAARLALRPRLGLFASGVQPAARFVRRQLAFAPGNMTLLRRQPVAEPPAVDQGAWLRRAETLTPASGAGALRRTQPAQPQAGLAAPQPQAPLQRHQPRPVVSAALRPADGPQAQPAARSSLLVTPTPAQAKGANAPEQHAVPTSAAGNFAAQPDGAAAPPVVLRAALLSPLAASTGQFAPLRRSPVLLDTSPPTPLPLVLRAPGSGLQPAGQAAKATGWHGEASYVGSDYQGSDFTSVITTALTPQGEQSDAATGQRSAFARSAPGFPMLIARSHDEKEFSGRTMFSQALSPGLVSLVRPTSNQLPNSSADLVAQPRDEKGFAGRTMFSQARSPGLVSLVRPTSNQLPNSSADLVAQPRDEKGFAGRTMFSQALSPNLVSLVRPTSNQLPNSSADLTTVPSGQTSSGARTLGAALQPAPLLLRMAAPPQDPAAPHQPGAQPRDGNSPQLRHPAGLAPLLVRRLSPDLPQPSMPGVGLSAASGLAPEPPQQAPGSPAARPLAPATAPQAQLAPATLRPSPVLIGAPAPTPPTLLRPITPAHAQESVALSRGPGAERPLGVNNDKPAFQRVALQPVAGLKTARASNPHSSQSRSVPGDLLPGTLGAQAAQWGAALQRATLTQPLALPTGAAGSGQADARPQHAAAQRDQQRAASQADARPQHAAAGAAATRAGQLSPLVSMIRPIEAAAPDMLSAMREPQPEATHFAGPHQAVQRAESMLRLPAAPAERAAGPTQPIGVRPRLLASASVAAPLLRIARTSVPAPPAPTLADELAAAHSPALSAQRSALSSLQPSFVSAQPSFVSPQRPALSSAQPSFVSAQPLALSPQPLALSPQPLAALLLRPLAPVQRAPVEPAAAPSAAATQSEPAEAAPAQPATAEPDIEALTQKVYEQLRRRLRIDQERLGRY